ncbi:MAG: phenylalanine--tRNA ligase subunit beta [Vicinamibacterales bacterium]
MRISLDWIADYTTLPAGLSPKEIAHQLTMTTVEVEGVHTVAGDIVLEIDNKSLTNRPDLWGHYGLARELAAIFEVPLRPLPAEEPDRPAATLVSSIEASVCRRFTATRIEGITVRDTPDWMTQRLTAIGQRSKNLYADLTNYVMLTTGQPTHAFDADRLALPLSVRWAISGERFEALDGTTIELTPSDAVVADERSAVGLAGVIGGRHSAILPDTTRVVFEAASFDPLAIRRTSGAHGLRTEASTRFEKSLSTHRIDEARRLFFHLLGHIDPGARVTGFDDRTRETTAAGEIRVGVAYLRDRIGKPLAVTELSAPLERLGFTVNIEGADLLVGVPEWRHTGDISGPHDLVEEIARLHGYERFDFQAPLVQVTRSARDYPGQAERRVREYLALVGGMREVITYPWIDDRFVTGAGLQTTDAPLRLSAPPAPDQATLRTSLMPGVLHAIDVNVRSRTAFRIFEVGAVFPVGTAVRLDDDRERLPPQPKHVAGAVVGVDAERVFREAKGILEALPRRAHVADVTFEPGGGAPWSDAGASMTLAGPSGAIGHIGILNRRATRAAGLKHAVAAVFEFALDGLPSWPSRDNRYTPLPELPAIEIDVSLTYADTVSWTDIGAIAARAAATAAPDVDATIEFIDQYRGANIPEGHRSITLRARLQPRSHTLTSEAATAIATAIREAERTHAGASER